MKPGDLLWTNGHVMLFERFLPEELPPGVPPGVPKILVCEASIYNGRVSYTEYEVERLDDITETWKGIPIPTHEVILKRVATYYKHYPCDGFLIRQDIRDHWYLGSQVASGAFEK